MRGTALLDELVNVAQRQGLTVRREAMTRGVSAGGMAMVKGVPTLFVDDRASVEAQIEVLAGALKRFDWSTVFLPPAIRSLLGAGLDDRLQPRATEPGAEGAPPAQAPATKQPAAKRQRAKPATRVTRRK